MKYFVKLLHYVLKCNQCTKYVIWSFYICVSLPAKKKNIISNRYCLDFLSKLLASLMGNKFPKRPLGTPFHSLSKVYDVYQPPRGSV